MSNTDAHTRNADHAAKVARRLARQATADFRRRRENADGPVSLDPRDYAKAV